MSVSQTVDLSTSAPLPRPQRKPKRPSKERGLPPDAEIRRLAEAYLASQRTLWPDLARQGLIPEPTPDELDQMVQGYKKRHAGASTEGSRLAFFATLTLRLAGIYARYSCDNSNPLSILDQMTRCLDRACKDKCFVPWEFVYADYSVSGTSASRQGYCSYKEAMKADANRITATYIDDFTRASRDEIEWWRLAALSKRLGKRMIGASDGFDLAQPNAEVMIMVFGLLSRLFLKGLREKVRRGMQGAASRGTVLGRLPFGFTKCQVGTSPTGEPVYRPCLDPATVDFLRQIFDLFVIKKWSAYRIAKYFSTLRVEGWNGWTGSGVRRMLHNPAAIGVFIWNRQRQEVDPEENKVVFVPNPRTEWVVYRNSELAAVPLSLWVQARRRLSETKRNCPLTGKPKVRKGQTASTLFSGTLRCAYCRGELKLARSGKYPMLGCLNGLGGVHGCPLRTKSTRIIETSLLEFIRNQVFSEKVVVELVDRANQFLRDQAKRPKKKTDAAQERCRELRAEIDTLVSRVKVAKDSDLIQVYEHEILALRGHLRAATQEWSALEASNREVPPPLDKDRVLTYLADLRGLLNQEIPAAAEAIRAITGMIEISHEVIPGRKTGARWIAKFQPEMLPLLCRLAGKGECPDTVTLEFLKHRNWTVAQPVVVSLERPKKLQQIAEKAGELKAKGCSILSIATALQTTCPTVKQALHYQQTGELPKGYKSAGNRTGKRGQPKYIRIADEVKRLRDVDLVPFTQISSDLGASLGTVTRAYDYASPGALVNALERGRKPQRGHYRRQPKPGVPLGSRA